MAELDQGKLRNQKDQALLEVKWVPSCPHNLHHWGWQLRWSLREETRDSPVANRGGFGVCPSRKLTDGYENNFVPWLYSPETRGALDANYGKCLGRPSLGMIQVSVAAD